MKRAVGRAVGAWLLISHLLIATAVIATTALSLSPSASLVGMVADSSPFYRIVVTTLSLALLMIASRYVYYYYCWLTTRHDFARHDHASASFLEGREIPFMKFQITTKGGALDVVERSLRELTAFCSAFPPMQEYIVAEVITEVADEANWLADRFRNSVLLVFPIALPVDYQTPNGTGYKARALHYLVEQRRAGFNCRPGKTFIVHLDEETMITQRELLVMLGYLTCDPRPISQGPIFYSQDWRSTLWICRAVECVRPFGCSECAAIMRNPPPVHLHGSNLVVEEGIENTIGWDFGSVDGQPFVAEDLIFGLKAYALLGKDAFGWHGAAMLEQPPPSAYWAFRQRKRWVQGALQGLKLIWRDHQFADMPILSKLHLQMRIAFRIATYMLGFPIGLSGIAFVLHNLVASPNARSLALPETPLGIALLGAGVAWLVSYQIGLARNLRSLQLPWYERFRQALIVLALTPVAGIVETVGPFLAVTENMFGISKAIWVPTPKLVVKEAVP